MSACERIAIIVDGDTFIERDKYMFSRDALGFTDGRTYPDRLSEARDRTGLSDALVTGTAQIGGVAVSLAVLDFAFLGGSMGAVVGEKFVRAAERALASEMPMLAVSASGGARMQEGVVSLVQMARTSAAIAELREAGLPYLSVLTDPVYGGVAASFAALGDVIIAERGARVGFAGPRVIEQTTGRVMPAGFQTAESLVTCGHIDAVTDRESLPTLLRQVVAHAAGRRSPARLRRAPPAPAAAGPAVTVPEPGQAITTVRAADRPRTRYYLARLCSDHVALRGDRRAADDPALRGSLARFRGVSVMVLRHGRGDDTSDVRSQHHGMPGPAGYFKAIRLMRLAARWRLPILTLVDTPGALPDVEAEQHNQAGAIAETLATAAGLPVPIVVAVTGEGGSGGALALATGDRVIMQSSATLSVISPEGCAAILFGDSRRAAEAAEALRLRAADLAELGLVDEVVAEPPGSAACDPPAAADLLGEALERHLGQLLDLPATELVKRRRTRFRSMARYWTQVLS
ncbi:carboxyl transferase domain-containing protein [Spirillospora sp. NPDC048911]|uniref:carboxyl transferase domain-containing protein n=1 Tax=Spirillospora sp. NPDC048911 TaxID=3364527 RepID=UPI00371AE0D6